ncbi:hypothetical protein SLS57_009666 [Botryosphaeria dothidea]
MHIPTNVVFNDALEHTVSCRVSRWTFRNLTSGFTASRVSDFLCSCISAGVPSLIICYGSSFSYTLKCRLTDNTQGVFREYPRLVRKMGEMPEVAIFRRFGTLNAQSLLYMQAELVCLEKKLHRLQSKDAAAPGRRSSNSGDQGDGDDDDDAQLELVKEIRAKLKEYNEMLIQQMKIVAVDPPSSWDLRHIQRYLVSEEMAHGVLTGKDATLWDPDQGHTDLLPLATRHNEDFFSSWVTESVSEKLIKLRQKRKPVDQRKLDDFADKKVLRWTFLFASVLASALPILAIVILYCVRSVKVRLGLIAVFNVVLSFALAWFTSAKRAEVFAVSAAFSAVQVVFVQVGASDTRETGG